LAREKVGDLDSSELQRAALLAWQMEEEWAAMKEEPKDGE